MQALNLPKTSLKITKQGGRLAVLDVLRKRYVSLTPEEWVRQHFVSFLLLHKGFPAARMANEVGISLNHTAKRCDTVVYDHEARPLVIIEYKAPHIPLTQQVLDQAWRYNMVLRVPFLMLSNGMQHVCIAMDYDTGGYLFLPDIPAWNEIRPEEI